VRRRPGGNSRNGNLPDTGSDRSPESAPCRNNNRL
jgi:hypothetical protein